MASQDHRPQITVLGSMNMDLVAGCATLPQPGETLTASGFAEIPGGKGANQAVAASRAGGDVRMVGRVGDDGFAVRLTQQLGNERVDCAAVHPSPGHSCGLALITVADSGQNQIVVVPGANGQVSCKDVDRHADLIRGSDVLLVQLEIPLQTVLYARELARRSGVRVILDPAPAPAEPPPELFDVDMICPNETETALLTGITPDCRHSVEAAVQALHRRGAAAVVLTLGHRGTAVFDGQVVEHVPAHAVDVMDTTAAGDAFAGATAVRWAEQGCLLEAVRFGNAAGALAASRAGAQPAMPQRQEIESLLDQSSAAPEEPTGTLK